MDKILSRFYILLIVMLVLLATIALPGCQSGSGNTSPTPSPQPTAVTPTPTPTTAVASTPTSTTAPSSIVNIDLSAQGFSFDKSTITVPAGASVTIHFANKDNAPHNFAAYESSAAQKSIFVGQIITGPTATIDYKFTAPTTPGTYFFRCDIHPSMKGSFVVT